jgi:hypothetical protein
MPSTASGDSPIQADRAARPHFSRGSNPCSVASLPQTDAPAREERQLGKRLKRSLPPNWPEKLLRLHRFEFQ